MNEKKERSYTVECPACGLVLGAAMGGMIEMDAPCPRCGEEAAIMFPDGYDEPGGLDEHGIPLPSRRDAYEATKPKGSIFAMIDQAEAGRDDAAALRAASWSPLVRDEDELNL